jgi:hypothetical protein
MHMRKIFFFLHRYLELQLCERIWSQFPGGFNKMPSLEAG